MSTPVRPARPLRWPVVLGAAVLGLAADLTTKVIVVGHQEGHQPVRWLGGAIYVDVARNSGAAWGLGTGMTAVLSVIALVVVAVIVRVARRLRSVGWALALGLILGGALGNLVDRLFRSPGVLRGHVVDWISVFGPNGVHYPIFNLADSCIVCGGVLAVLQVVRGIELSGARSDDRRKAKAAASDEAERASADAEDVAPRAESDHHG